MTGSRDVLVCPVPSCPTSPAPKLNSAEPYILRSSARAHTVTTISARKRWISVIEVHGESMRRIGTGVKARNEVRSLHATTTTAAFLLPNQDSWFETNLQIDANVMRRVGGMNLLLLWRRGWVRRPGILLVEWLVRLSLQPRHPPLGTEQPGHANHVNAMGCCEVR